MVSENSTTVKFTVNVCRVTVTHRRITVSENSTTVKFTVIACRNAVEYHRITVLENSATVNFTVNDYRNAVEYRKNYGIRKFHYRQNTVKGRHLCCRYFTVNLRENFLQCISRLI